jgi:hypothetical protein
VAGPLSLFLRSATGGLTPSFRHIIPLISTYPLQDRQGVRPEVWAKMCHLAHVSTFVKEHPLGGVGPRLEECSAEVYNG